ncbi:EAL domain-containing protein [Cupriavidus necator]
MTAWFDRLSLRAKLGAGFAVLIVLMLVVGAASSVSHQHALAAAETYFERYDRIADLSLQSNAAMLNARRYEKEFLLKRGEFGYKEARSRYATLVRTQLATVRENMDTIRSLTDNAELAEKTEAIAAVTRRYERGFLHVVDLYGQLGREEFGLEGQFRQRAHAIEAVLGTSAHERLLIDLLSLRRAEKDFIMRGQSANVGTFELAISQFRRRIAGAELPPDQRRKLLRLVNEYGERFNDYVRAKSEIETGTLAFLSEVHAVEPMLDQLYRKAYQTVEITRATLRSLNLKTTWTVISGSLAAFFFGVVVSILIARSINRSVRTCVDFAARVTDGDLAVRLPSVSPIDFGVLITGLNQMAESLQESRRLEDERLVELSRLNRNLRMLSECNYSLVRATSEAQLLDMICRQVVETGGYRLAWVGLAMHDEARSIRPAAIAGADHGYVASLGLSWGNDECRLGMAGRAIREGRPVAVCNLPTDPIYELWREAAAQRGLISSIALPLLIKSEVVGALSIYAIEAGDFDSEEVKLLQELADNLAFGIAGLRESTARAHAERILDYQSNYDTVTGLANRNLLHDRLREATGHAAHSGGQMAVLLLGLDRFKAINESLGHAAGDAMLKHVAQRLSANLREGDTVGRLAGDEFVVLMRDLARIEDVGHVARTLLEAIGQQPTAVAGEEIFTSASVGISLYPKDGADSANLLQRAETAMHSAKALGGNTFRFYARDMNERVSTRFALEGGLRKAIERGELLTHYQPKLSLASGRITGAEALVRWDHPELGMIPPADFIPLAEDSGLIVPLGEWILDNVCRQLRCWLNAGLSVPSVAVNLSARQFRLEGLADLIRRSLLAYQLPSRLLELEITESSLMDNLDSAMITLRELKSIGVKISLDDFGTGYSSLGYLKRFPVDQLKIDRTFVRDIVTDPDDAAICTAVISLAHTLKLKVIAEGVETAAQMIYLHEHRCDEIQGYYFSAPLSAEDYARLLAESGDVPEFRAEGTESTSTTG